MFASNQCVWARALSLGPARALDHCLKRESSNGRGAAEGNTPLGLDSYYFADTFLINPDKEQQSAQL